MDAAALAAAAQFRVGATTQRLQSAAEEVVHMNGVDPTSLTLALCGPADTYPDNPLCPKPGAPHRKLVKVTATSQVRFAFLGIIGIPSTQIIADSTSETASVDVVLVIDTSNSMTFDCLNAGNALYPCSQNNPTSSWWPDVCNAVDTPDPADSAHPYKGNCLPFDQVKHAAVDFVRHLYWPYDRLSIVTFAIG